ncbi:MAG TPA: hypothetical protein VFX59_12245 [Polyangiales bacterium]|nr:hypothetical protein [Polyangiales bacterium]
MMRFGWVLGVSAAFACTDPSFREDGGMSLAESGTVDAGEREAEASAPAASQPDASKASERLPDVPTGEKAPCVLGVSKLGECRLGEEP